MIPLRDVIPSRTTPYITVTIILLNAIAWVYELSVPGDLLPVFLQVYGVVPARLHALTLVTSMFLHGSWMHVIGNMWYLWIFGDNVEDRVGHGRFIVFYLLCGIAASLGQILIDPESTLPTIGASGAIAGVMGGY
ncbi:MAG TPA: rhomboid family intramembrane serine protease, partial [Vicinamibacterales bacterium]